MTKADDCSINRPDDMAVSRAQTTHLAKSVTAKARSILRRKRKRNPRRAKRASKNSKKRKMKCKKRSKIFQDGGKSILTLRISSKAKQNKMTSPRKPATMSVKSMLKRKRVPFLLLRILRRPLRCKEKENNLKIPIKI
jgi:hypothetical protein